MLDAGSEAPDFTLQDSDGNDRSLAEFVNDGPIILYFYPADFTPGCTKEACDIRDIHKDILSAGLRVVGVSPQDADSHQRFRDEHDLPFPLLCDPDKRAIKSYGVDGPLGIGVRRATFLINRDQTIEDAVLADLFVGRHAEFIRKAVEMQKSDG